MFTVAFLGIAAGLQMADMGLQAVSLAAIQTSFGVSDATLGALQGLAGILIASALAIPLSRFADRYSRKRVLLWLIAVSSVLMALSGLAHEFPLFFIGRSAAGITEFAMVPLVYSMIPDLAPERHRVAANLGFAALMAAGASGGFYFSGAILSAAQDLFPWGAEPWRKAFLLLGMAGLPLLLLGALTADPARRIEAADAASSASLRAFLLRRWRAIGLFAGVAGCLIVAVQALNQLVALALERRFNAAPGEIGHAMGLIILITSVGCLPVAGLLDRAMVRRVGQAVRPLIMGLSAVMAIPVLLLLTAAQALDHAFVAVGLFLFMTCTANALVPTMLQDLAPASLRARCFAIWSFVVSLFGASGPLLAGTLSDWLFQRHMLNAVAAVAVPALAISAACALRSFLRTLKEQGLAARPA
ncbi:MFS transporter [uncultured Castellaniella sp.]|uniref:MFS transporter n=1 Tax=uncultured Castellaniella sp. TaxID=647907 RepID=UPI002605D63B|nr:MFS transporter [uncultured Castellaniella sp.]